MKALPYYVKSGMYNFYNFKIWNILFMETIEWNDFTKVELRVGKIVEV